MFRRLLSCVLIPILVSIPGILSVPAGPPAPIITAGQFVYAPAETNWDIEAALDRLDSPLAPYAGVVEVYALMSSVDPRVLLIALEMEAGLVTHSDPLHREQVVAALDSISRRLYQAFYSRRPEDSEAHSWETRDAGSQAIELVLGQSAEREFTATARGLFPDFDLLDESNVISLQAVPPSDLLQFPYPLGEAWQFNGTHGWAGYTEPPSSIDFSRQWPPCGLPHYDEVVVSAGAGMLRKPREYADCWLEIDHAGGWTTSYYHLTDVVIESGWVEPDTPLGRVGCETCVGGWATAAHVHFSLKYNGAYVSLDGVTLSGWTVHPGPVPYSAQTRLSRADLVYSTYSRLLNDGGVCSLVGAAQLLSPPHGSQLDSGPVSLHWDPPAGEPTPSSYLVRVRTAPEMEGGTGETVLSQRLSGTEETLHIPMEYMGRELYWSVQAWRLGACSPWAAAWQFRVGPPATAVPHRLSLPLLLKRVVSWPIYPTITVTSTYTPATGTPTATETATFTGTPVATGTATPTATATSTAGTTPTASPTPSATTSASPPTSTPTATRTVLTQEAEDGQLAWPMTEAYDALASGRYFVHTPAGLPATGLCRLTFDMPVAGRWEIWARGVGLNDESDEFQVIVDMGTPLIWEVPQGEWTWDLITNIELTAGQHVLSFVTSENRSRLDVVELRPAESAP